MSTIPESDWKILRNLKSKLLASACERVFQGVDNLSECRAGREHEAYLELWELIQEQNTAIAEMFDDLRRSNALLKIAALRRNGILTDEYLMQFSEETQNRARELTKF